MKNKIIFFLFFLCQITAYPIEKLTLVLDWSVNTNHTGLYAALENEYFKNNGLDVSIEFPPETGAASLVLAEKAQFFISYQEEITFARAKNKPLKAIAAIIQHNTSAFASRKNINITRPRDFEGKRYGGWGSPMEDAILKALMEKDKGDFKKIKILAIGSMDFFAATKKNIDFAWIFEGWDGVAANLKNIELNIIRLRDIEPSLDYYTPVLASTDKYLKSNPATTRKFMAAVSQGYNFAINNPEKAALILLKHAPELDKNLVIQSQIYLAKEYQKDATKWGLMKLKIWKNFLQWMKKYNLLEDVFDPAAAYTNEFLP